MAKNLSTKIEDKYVFTVSTFFWRILVAVAALGVVAGAALFLWGLIPAFKSSPDKETYPPVASVSFDEIRSRLSAQQQSRPAVTPQQLQGSMERGEDKSEQILRSMLEYRTTLDTLRALMPESRYAWQSQGRWSYPYGERYYNYYRDERYRQWIVTAHGIPDRMGEACNKAGITSGTERRQFVLACAKFVRGYPLDKRGQPLDAALKVAQSGITKSVSNLALLGSLRDRLLKDQTDLLLACADFLGRNPSDGAPLLQYTSTAVDSFDVTVRNDGLITMMADYSQRFNNQLDRQKEFTNLFLPMAKNFEPKLQVSALEQYYDLAIAKNAARERAIRRIDAQHESALAQAEHEYQAASTKKGERRVLGVYGMGAGLGTIAFVALLLVLLSIQRYVRRIVERLDMTTPTASGP